MTTRLLSRGFTLMELMITVLIVGILASVAIPNYSEHVAKSRRAEAQSTLLQVASWMERYFTENNRYDTSTLPTTFANVPQTGTAYYTVTISASTTTTYTLTATRAGIMANDRCGDFSYTQANVKSVQNNATGTSATTCWGQ